MRGGENVSFLAISDKCLINTDLKRNLFIDICLICYGLPRTKLPKLFNGGVFTLKLKALSDGTCFTYM